MRYIFIFLLPFVLVACHKKPVEKAPIPIKAFQVESHTIPAHFEFVGVARSSHQVEIRARVEGYLEQIAYTEGSYVEEGKLLFQIDHRPFLASLEEAKGGLARQEAILWRAQKSLSRIEPLYKQNAASQRDFDDAYAQVLAAEAQVIVAKANVVQAELNLSYTYITSPITGWTGRSIYREGTLITPSINGLLTYVSIIDPVWVYFSISDNDLLQGRAEGAAQELILPETDEFDVVLTLADGSTFPYKGKVNFKAPQIDPQTGTLSVRAEFKNPKNELLPGQFVQAEVIGASRPNALFVPQTALFQGNKGKYLFLIKTDNTVVMQEVETGAFFENYWVITAGLKPGDLVVSEGVNKVHNGASVHVLSTDTYQSKE